MVIRRDHGEATFRFGDDKLVKTNEVALYTDMVNKALYQKYSSSQNYYFSRDVNEILSSIRSPNVILI